jgi:hypothetical protein
MAILAIPLAFAAGGGLLFGNIGMAAGWLIGAWLFGPKSETQNQIFDPGAQEMPRFNQSLRGVTIPILFGTNRVASNIVWVKNFQTIRTETPQQGPQGGGKSGGSGGHGKGQQAAAGTNVSYEYKWDMMFHMGMVPEPYSLYGGWYNTQRMSGDTILAISQGSAGTSTLITCPPGSGPILSLLGRECNHARSITLSVNGGAAEAQKDNIANMTFDDSFFGEGGPADSDVYANWDYFQAQEGFPNRWPNTLYVGFKALSLGSTAGVPQLSWEVGPGTATFECDSVFLTEDPDGNSANNGLGGTNTMVVGEDGKHYILTQKPTEEETLRIQCIEDDTFQEVTKDTLLPFVDGVPTPAAGATVFMMGGSPYILYVGWQFPGGLSVSHYGMVYKINAAGVLEATGLTHVDPCSGDELDPDFTLCNESKRWIFRMKPKAFAFISYDEIMDESSGFPTWACDNGIGDVCLLSIRPFNGTNGSVSYPGMGVSVSGPGSRVFVAPVDPPLAPSNLLGYQTGYGSDPTGRAFFVPYVDGGEQISYLLGIYVSKTDVHHLNTAVVPVGLQSAAAAACNAGGQILAYRIQNNEFTIGYDDFTPQFVTQTNAPFIPQVDTATDLDGALNYGADYMNPCISKHSSGATILCWPKRYEKTADFDVKGSKTKIVVQVWNPITMQAKTYAERTCEWFDVRTDLEFRGPLDVTNPWSDCMPYFDSNLGVVIIAGRFSPGNSNVGPNVITGLFGPLQIGGGGDVLPPYIIYEILTNPVFGMGIDPATIDETSYQLALQYCEGEEIRVSAQYLREESVLGIIDELLSLYGGYLIDSGGRIKFGVQQFTASPVRTIDNDHLVIEQEGNPPVTVTKGALQDGYNKVRVNYFDRDLDYRQNQVEVGDEVDQDFNGIRFKEFGARFVMKPLAAQKIAERALWTNLYTRDQFEFALGWKDADLEPGDVITLVDSFHPELQDGKNVRIVKWKEKRRGVFNVNAVLEVAYAMTAGHTPTSTSSAGGAKGLATEVLPMADFRLYELPREFQTTQSFLYAGYNQQSNIRGAQLYFSVDGVSYAIATQAEPYLISGVFGKALPAQSPGDMERDIDIYLMPASGFTTATPTFCQTLALSDVSEQLRGIGGGTLYAGSEALAMEGLTLMGQNHYRISRLYRGWGGTLPQAHSSGAYWHKHGNGILKSEITPDRIGNLLYYKVVPYNFALQPYDVGSIAAKTYIIKGTSWLPQNQSDFRVNVESPLTGSSADMAVSPLYRGIDATLKSNVTFEWEDTARQEGFGFGGYGNAGFGHYASDVDIHRWRVEIVSGNTVVRSTIVTSGQFTYTVAQNSADFNGFAGVYGVRVVPFNSYGDAPINAVRSINLFW